MIRIERAKPLVAGGPNIRRHEFDLRVNLSAERSPQLPRSAVLLSSPQSRRIVNCAVVARPSSRSARTRDLRQVIEFPRFLGHQYRGVYLRVTVAEYSIMTPVRNLRSTILLIAPPP